MDKKKKKKKKPSQGCIIWYRRICSLISPRCIDAWSCGSRKTHSLAVLQLNEAPWFLDITRLWFYALAASFFFFFAQGSRCAHVLRCARKYTRKYSAGVRAHTYIIANTHTCKDQHAHIHILAHTHAQKRIYRHEWSVYRSYTLFFTLPRLQSYI